jgi:hypothetical protein
MKIGIFAVDILAKMAAENALASSGLVVAIHRGEPLPCPLRPSTAAELETYGFDYARDCAEAGDDISRADIEAAWEAVTEAVKTGQDLGRSAIPPKPSQS